MPSPDELTVCQAAFVPRSSQLNPESSDVYMLPPLTTAANLAPSAEEVMLLHARLPKPVAVISHVAPLLVEIARVPPLMAAASLVPSAADATETQANPPPVRSVQLLPELVDV